MSQNPLKKTKVKRGHESEMEHYFLFRVVVGRMGGGRRGLDNFLEDEIFSNF